jgi:hypothetical protein
VPLRKQSFTAKELADGESLGGCSHLKLDFSSDLKTRYGRNVDSRYQVQLSETARADFDRLRAEAESTPDSLRQLLEVHALLDLLAVEDGTRDGILPATAPEGALRYRSEGGVYIYFRRIEETRTVTVVFFRELQPRLVGLKLRDIPHGLETESSMEFTGEDGSKRRMRSFTRKVDWGDSYTLFNHFAMDAQPPRTMITSGKKGQVEGDWRRDVIEVVELLADGSARSHPPQTVPVWLRNPFYEATSKKDMLARLEKNPIPSARLEEFRRLLENEGDSA